MNLNLQNLFKNTKSQQTFEAGTVAERDRADSIYVVLDGEVESGLEITCLKS
jgi:hypothetical protein